MSDDRNAEAIFREHTVDGLTYQNIATARHMTRQQVGGIIYRYRLANGLKAAPRAAAGKQAAARRRPKSTHSRPLTAAPVVLEPPRNVAMSRWRCSAGANAGLR
jgi:hypothetical protein